MYELIPELPEWEFSFWNAYFSKEPPPEERQELLLATLCASAANKGRRGKKKSPKDFLFFKDAFQYEPDSGNSDVDSDIKTLMAAFAPRLVVRPID